jgi:hypothetical protein
MRYLVLKYRRQCAQVRRRCGLILYCLGDKLEQQPTLLT